MVKLRRVQEGWRHVGHQFAPLALLCVLSQMCIGSSILLRDVTKETGITFKHTDGGS